jgi:hypothetical protein
MSLGGRRFVLPLSYIYKVKAAIFIDWRDARKYILQASRRPMHGLI